MAGKTQRRGNGLIALLLGLLLLAVLAFGYVLYTNWTALDASRQLRINVPNSAMPSAPPPSDIPISPPPPTLTMP